MILHPNFPSHCHVPSMANDELFDHLSLTLRPDPSRTVVRPFAPDGVSKSLPRQRRIAERVAALPHDEIVAIRTAMRRLPDERIIDVDARMMQRCDAMRAPYVLPAFYKDRAFVARAYFSHEFAPRNRRAVQSECRPSSRPVPSGPQPNL